MRCSYKKPIRKYKGGKAAREQFRDQQLNDSIMYLMRNGWGVNAIAGALGNALHESRDWRHKFRGDLDPNITEGDYSGIFNNGLNERQAIIDATGGYSLEDQLAAADMFAKGQLTRKVFGGSGKYNRRGYSSPTEAAAEWEKYYERSGGQGMQERLQHAQDVRDYIVANKDQYGRMFNPMISVRNRQSYDMPWVGSNNIEQVAGINSDGTIRTYNKDTNIYSSRELELPEYVVRPLSISKPRTNLQTVNNLTPWNE